MGNDLGTWGHGAQLQTQGSYCLTKGLCLSNSWLSVFLPHESHGDGQLSWAGNQVSEQPTHSPNLS